MVAGGAGIGGEALVRALRAYMRETTGVRDPLELWDHLTRQSARSLGFDGAGICTVEDGERFEFRTASGTDIAALEHEQIASGAGPGVDAVATGRPSLCTDVATEGRWESFGELARRSGFRAVAGIPVQVGNRTLGALDLYQRQVGVWREDGLAAIQALAGLVAVHVARLEELEAARRANDQLQGALDSRVVIEQAKGVIAARHGLDLADAFERLRRHARDSRSPLRTIAEDVVEGRSEL